MNTMDMDNIELSSSSLSDIEVSSPPAITSGEPQSPPQPTSFRRRRRPLTRPQKLDICLKSLQEHRWTLWDVLEELFKTQKYQRTYFLNRLHTSSTVLDVIVNHNQENVLKRLDGGNKQIQQEVRSLASTSVFGRFDRSNSLSFLDLDMPSMMRVAKQQAPNLLHLLKGAMEPLRDQGRSELEGRYVLIIGIICFTSQRENCANIPTLIGLYLHSHGVKRRVLDVLHKLGINVSYQSINRNLKDSKAKDDVVPIGSQPDGITEYDNFGVGNVEAEEEEEEEEEEDTTKETVEDTTTATVEEDNED